MSNHPLPDLPTQFRDPRMNSGQFLQQASAGITIHRHVMDCAQAQFSHDVLSKRGKKSTTATSNKTSEEVR